MAARFSAETDFALALPALGSERLRRSFPSSGGSASVGISPVAIFATMIAFPITSAGRFRRLGSRGMFALLIDERNEASKIGFGRGKAAMADGPDGVTALDNAHAAQKTSATNIAVLSPPALGIAPYTIPNAYRFAPHTA